LDGAYPCEEIVGSESMALAAQDAALKAGKTMNVHLNLDSGMGRAGRSWSSVGEVVEFAKLVRDRCPSLVVRGIMTHFPRADVDFEGTRAAIGRFLSAYHLTFLRCFSFLFLFFSFTHNYQNYPPSILSNRSGFLRAWRKLGGTDVFLRMNLSSSIMRTVRLWSRLGRIFPFSQRPSRRDTRYGCTIFFVK
jgi:hypothetical protein